MYLYPLLFAVILLLVTLPAHGFHVTQTKKVAQQYTTSQHRGGYHSPSTFGISPTNGASRQQRNHVVLSFCPTATITQTTRIATINTVRLVSSTSLFQKKRGKGPEEMFSSNSNDLNDDIDSSSSALLPQSTSPELQEASRVLRRVSWFSWWSQVILTTVSGVILGFARRTLVQRTSALSSVAAAGSGGASFFLSGTGLIVSAASIVWTWGNGARLSRRLTRRPVTRRKAAHMLRRAVRVGVTLNLVGLLVNLLAAEEIVGSLAIQVLTTSSRGGPMMYLDGMVQPLDILVVQANTNSLLSHFCSLASLLFLTRQIDKLDPPSPVEDSK